MGISQRLFDMIPNRYISGDKLLKRIYRTGDRLGRPMQNRLIMGGTAILSQPFIDENNKRVDKDTARASRNRTIGKILAGTTVGCIVRGGIYRLIEKSTEMIKGPDKWNNILTPRALKDLSDNVFKIKIMNYRTAVSTIIAMIIMLGTNVLFDVPLTNMISNFLNKRDAKRKQNNVIADKPQQVNNSVNITNKIRDKFKVLKGGIS